MINNQEFLEELRSAIKLFDSAQPSDIERKLTAKLEELSANIEGWHERELQPLRDSQEQLENDLEQVRSELKQAQSERLAIQRGIEQLGKKVQFWRFASLSLIIIGLVAGILLISLTPAPPTLLITSFKNDDAVDMTILVTGRVAKSSMTDGRKLYVFVRPHGLYDQDPPFNYWVQPTPVINSDGTWKVSRVGVGQEHDSGRSFDICAVLTSQTITSTNYSVLPPGPASCNTVIRK